MVRCAEVRTAERCSVGQVRTDLDQSIDDSGRDYKRKAYLCGNVVDEARVFDQGQRNVDVRLAWREWRLLGRRGHSAPITAHRGATLANHAMQSSEAARCPTLWAHHYRVSRLWRGRVLRGGWTGPAEHGALGNSSRLFASRIDDGRNQILCREGYRVSSPSGRNYRRTSVSKLIPPTPTLPRKGGGEN